MATQLNSWLQMAASWHIKYDNTNKDKWFGLLIVTCRPLQPVPLSCAPVQATLSIWYTPCPNPKYPTLKDLLNNADDSEEMITAQTIENVPT